MAEPIALAALAVEAAVGWPGWLYRRVGHPVGAFARAIDAAERRWNRPALPPAVRRALGVVLVVLLLGATAAVVWGLEAIARAALGRWGWVAVALLAWPGLAPRSLDDHVRPVARALAQGDLPAARAAVARVVGRDVDRLAAAGVARAAIETLAESFCDGVVAPLGWLLVGGLPALWAYKALNTADSLIGHREPRWRAFGWAAARGDDVANWGAARAAGVLLCLAAPGGWRAMARDHGAHPSPNGGWPEAAMAGALGIALAGPASYDGAMADKPWINAGGRAATAADLNRGLAIHRRACLLLALIAGGVAWAR